MTAHDTGLQLDDLSDWELPPSSAGDMRPVRVFDSAEAALRFLGVERGIGIATTIEEKKAPQLQPNRIAYLSDHPARVV